MRNIRLYFGLLCFVLLSACDRADDITGNTYHTDVFKVAVIAPDHQLPYWERTADWAHTEDCSEDSDHNPREA